MDNIYQHVHEYRRETIEIFADAFGPSYVSMQAVLTSTKNWILHDDNSPFHWALPTHEFLPQNDMVSLSRPPYLPDLASTDSYLFHKMKMQLKVLRFKTVIEIKSKSQKVINSLTEIYFQAIFQKPQEGWNWCI